MRAKSLFSIILILSAGACLDRIFINVGTNPLSIIVVDGQISDQPGPYKIVINTGQDLESKISQKPISVKQLTISDDHGTNETLSEIAEGIYQTDSTGIRGTVGRVYKLRIELLDGRVYESKPDTLFPPGKVDSVYFNFKSEISDQYSPTNGSDKYGFDVFFNSSAGSKSNYHFLWNFTGTFQSDTNPEMACDSPPPALTNCEPCAASKPCSNCAICNYKPLCSGLRNVSKFPDFPRAVFVRVAPCSCCTCWYNLFNPVPIISDSQLAKDGLFTAVKANYIPLSGWIFQHKVYMEVSQLSLSSQTYDFWRAVKSQKDAIGSLFQPVTGKIPSNFVQISGQNALIGGLFFATSISRKAVFITRNDVPNQSIIPPTDLPWKASCLTLFPNGTVTKPNFWKD